MVDSHFMHWAGYVLITLIFTFGSKKLPRAELVKLLIAFVGGTLFLLIWGILAGRGDFVHLASLQVAHRISAYLMYAYACTSGCIIRLILRRS